MPADGAPLLRVEHLTMRFGGLIAVNDISFTARHGDITAIIGPNGAGKTTVFNCITGFYKPTTGRMVLAPGGEAPDAFVDRLTRSGRPVHRRPARQHFSAGADAGLRDRLARQGRAHVPEHSAVLGHDRAREPDRGAAQFADARLGMDRAGSVWRAVLPQ